MKTLKLLNSDKTEMLVLGPKKQRDLLLNLTINLNGCTVISNKTVKDLGVTLDPDLSFDKYINTVSRTAFFHLCNIRTFLLKMPFDIRYQLMYDGLYQYIGFDLI